MNKQGIVVKFLVTLILALIIFTPACFFGAKIFRLSEQGGNNFVDFIESAQQFSKEEKEISSFILILDEETSLTVFPNHKRQLFHSEKKVEASFQVQQQTIEEYYTKVSDQFKPLCQATCACLCQKFTWDKKVRINVVSENTPGVSVTRTSYDVPCEKELCAIFPQSEAFSLYRDEELSRRNVIAFSRSNGGIKLER